MTLCSALATATFFEVSSSFGHVRAGMTGAGGIAASNLAMGDGVGGRVFCNAALCVGLGGGAEVVALVVSNGGAGTTVGPLPHAAIDVAMPKIAA